MVKQNKNNYLWMGIAVIAVIVIGVIFISNSDNNSQNEITCNSPYIKVGTECCLDKNYNDVCDNKEVEKTIFDVNNLEISMEGEKDINVYLSGEGGPYDNYNFIEIINNNKEKIYVEVNCNNPISRYNGYCESFSGNEIFIQGNSRHIQEIHSGATISPKTKVGSYKGYIYVKLIKYWDNFEDKWVYVNTDLKSYPITINVLCELSEEYCNEY